MIISIFIGVVCIITQMALAPQIENFHWRVAIMMLAGIGYFVSLIIASDRYNKLASRIKTLEDKVENNAKHIYKLSKKQSGKTIEYYTDEM